jgi:hypothetical protein
VIPDEETPELPEGADAQEGGSEPATEPSAERPTDDVIYRQALAGVYKVDRQLGRVPDEHSKRLAASLAALAKRSGLEQIDHVALSVEVDGKDVRAGENVFAVQGEPDDPAHHRVHMKTSEALSKPPRDDDGDGESTGPTGGPPRRLKP